MIIIINILAPYEAILSFEKITRKHGKIKTFLKGQCDENDEREWILMKYSSSHSRLLNVSIF